MNRISFLNRGYAFKGLLAVYIYISSSEFKISEFSRVRSTSENIYVFNSRDEIYLVFTEKKSKFSFYFIQYTDIFQFTRQAMKMQKPKVFENTNNFGTTLFLTF